MIEGRCPPGVRRLLLPAPTRPEWSPDFPQNLPVGFGGLGVVQDLIDRAGEHAEKCHHGEDEGIEPDWPLSLHLLGAEERRPFRANPSDAAGRP